MLRAKLLTAVSATAVLYTERDILLAQNPAFIPAWVFNMTTFASYVTVIAHVVLAVCAVVVVFLITNAVYTMEETAGEHRSKHRFLMSFNTSTHLQSPRWARPATVFSSLASLYFVLTAAAVGWYAMAGTCLVTELIRLLAANGSTRLALSYLHGLTAEDLERIDPAAYTRSLGPSGRRRDRHIDLETQDG
jgi:hypothetical protein